MLGRDSQGLDPGARYAFADFLLDPARETLAGPDGEITLRPKTFAVLSYLLARAGRLCTKEELLDAIWGDTVVTDDSLAQCLVEIRRALGDQERKIIRTVPRRGYLVDTEVRRVGAGMTAVGAGIAPAGSADVASADEGRPPVSRAGYISGVPRASRLGFESVVAGVILVGLFAFMTWQVVDEPDGGAELAAMQPSDADTAAMFTAEDLAVRETTVAVLPFADMSRAGDQRYFADGMAEEILNLLAEARELRVIARTSSFSLRGQALDVPAIGRRLGATHVLEGSVRPDGDRVRVTVQLADARDGAHVWSRAYDRPLGQVLALQDEIAADVARSLHATLVDEPGEPPSIDPRAYDHKLRGAYLFSRRHAGDLEAAREQFEAALALEPRYGDAWVGLAGVRWVLMLQDDWIEPEELAAFREAALRGVELSPGMPEAHLRAAASYAVIGSASMQERHMEMARELDPDNTLLLGMLAGRAIRAGQLERALDYQYRALRGDPLHLVTRANLVSFLLAAARVEEARREFDAFAQLGGQEPGLEASLLLLEGRYAEAAAILQPSSDKPLRLVREAMAMHGLGQEAEAAARLEPLRSRQSYEAAFALAEFAAWRGDVDAGLEWLRQARARLAEVTPVPSVPNWPHLVTLSPFIAPLRADPRFIELDKMP